MTEYSTTSAFWLFNRVTNFAYLRYDLISEDIKRVIHETEDRNMAEIPAVDAAAEKDPSVRCGIYRFGTKFMVSPFESADTEACALFVRNYSDRFPGLWTYTAR